MCKQFHTWKACYWPSFILVLSVLDSSYEATRVAPVLLTKAVDYIFKIEAGLDLALGLAVLHLSDH